MKLGAAFKKKLNKTTAGNQSLNLFIIRYLRCLDEANHALHKLCGGNRRK